MMLSFVSLCMQAHQFIWLCTNGNNCPPKLNVLDADGKHTLITGGGTFNGHLMRALTKPADVCIRNVPVDAVVPSAEMIKGKEAHAFGCLGLLRWLGEANVWSSVTGCSVSHLGGALWGKNAVSSPSPNAMKRS